MKKEKLKNTKIWIGKDLDLSARVQSIAFSLGIKWASGASKEITKPINYIIFDEAYGGGRVIMRYSRFTEGRDNSEARRIFSENTNLQITLSEIENLIVDSEWQPKLGDSIICTSLDGFPSEFGQKYMESDGLTIGGIYRVRTTGKYGEAGSHEVVPCVTLQESKCSLSHPVSCFKPLPERIVNNYISPRMEEYTRIVKATDIVVGDYLHISKKPNIWDGVLSESSPRNLIYPQILRVNQIKAHNPGYISADVGGYGFCLCELLKDGIVRRAYAHELPADTTTFIEHDSMASAAIKLISNSTYGSGITGTLYVPKSRYGGGWTATHDPAFYDPTNLVIRGVTKAITQKVPDKIRVEEIPMLRVPNKPGDSPTSPIIQRIRLRTPTVFFLYL